VHKIFFELEIRINNRAFEFDRTCLTWDNDSEQYICPLFLFLFFDFPNKNIRLVDCTSVRSLDMLFCVVLFDHLKFRVVYVYTRKFIVLQSRDFSIPFLVFFVET
jgi:hypothetical protein